MYTVYVKIVSSYIYLFFLCLRFSTEWIRELVLLGLIKTSSILKTSRQTTRHSKFRVKIQPFFDKVLWCQIFFSFGNLLVQFVLFPRALVLIACFNFQRGARYKNEMSYWCYFRLMAYWWRPIFTKSCI